MFLFFQISDDKVTLFYLGQKQKLFNKMRRSKEKILTNKQTNKMTETRRLSQQLLGL